jgi:hypothetical protein
MSSKNLTVNLNQNASALCGDNTKVRVRVDANGVLQIRPTNRVEGKNLPKGEVLVELRLKKQATPAFRFTLPEQFQLALGGMFRATPAKKGWISLEVLSDEERAAALVVGGGRKPSGASVSAR